MPAPRPTRPIGCAARLSRCAPSGFEPRVEDNGDIVLGNRPFEALMNDARLLICTMNLALCRGLMAGLDSPEWKVRFEPNPARCCVVFETRARCA
jgi:hypothetical protein